MSNDYFRFKQFTVHQDRCAMKVGMDGVTLGALVSSDLPSDSSLNILDIGTGTALISLMMAQRYPSAHITAIDIDESAVSQAKENVSDSPFSSRIEVAHISLQEYQDISTKKFDIIVSNPPYFTDAIKNPDIHRSTARHTDTLSFHDLIRGGCGLLADNGIFTIIIPSESIDAINEETIYAGLHLYKTYAINTVAGKPVRRYVMTFRKEYTKIILNSDLYLDSNEYKTLTSDFYL